MGGELAGKGLGGGMGGGLLLRRVTAPEDIPLLLSVQNSPHAEQEQSGRGGGLE